LRSFIYLIMNEIWKDIPGYQGLYQASNLGRIRSLDHNIKRDSYNIHNVKLKGRIFNPTVHQSGYLRTPLRKGGITKHIYVHNLIALTFLGQKINGYDVDHIDHNRKNNYLSNLRYITIKENRGIIGNNHASKKYKQIIK
jgi:hypothetical protein